MIDGFHRENPEIAEQVYLSGFTTLEIGGPARFFVKVADVNQLQWAIDWARARLLPFFVLGGGSNIVVSDLGFDGLAIKMDIPGLEFETKDGCASVTAGAGEEWDNLVRVCVDQNYTGIECLSGIPGLVGATPIQNVGAYGQEVSETIVSVEAFDIAAGKVVTIEAGDCMFGYRASRFKGRDSGRFVITRVSYRLPMGTAPAVRYPELDRYLKDSGLINPSLSQVREAVLTIRRRKGMVVDRSSHTSSAESGPHNVDSLDSDTRSAGSFFVNPIVNPQEFEAVKLRAEQLGCAAEPVPAFPAGGGRVKLSAAWLIERAGVGRGYTKGRASVSTKHSLALVNRGGATAAELLDLATEIKSRVQDLFGVGLTVEPVLVGFDGIPSSLGTV
jgi:UDP-N-acetylmuramate dehydrogenase